MTDLYTLAKAAIKYPEDTSPTGTGGASREMTDFKRACTPEAIIELCERVKTLQKKEVMPDEQTALKIMFDAYLRLIELGFQEAIYCPKDGSVFDAIEAGSTGIHTCNYQGEWPNGRWWVHEAGDLWPSRPILFRLKEKQND